MQNTDRFFAFTGGPGAGKTTLIDALKTAGLAAAPEAGRAVIRQQHAIEGPALPWVDRALFAETMLSFDMRSHEQARDLAGPCLFDRGIPDIVGYLTLERLPVPDHLMKAAENYRYNRTVFILPPWQAIYESDEERRQDWPTALATHAAIADAYIACGYRLCEVPCAPVEERCRFVLGRLAA